MARTPQPSVSAAELAVITELSQEVCSYLGHHERDSDAHTSALIVANWLELLYGHVVRRAEALTDGQLPLPGLSGRGGAG
jgi:hypothetical protein